MKPNLSKLKTIAETKLGVAFFKLCAARERGRQHLALNRTRRLLREAGTPSTPADMAKLFADLEDAGVGRVIYGRGNKITRLQCGYNILSVAKAALGKTTGVKKQNPTKIKLPDVDLASNGAAAPEVETRTEEVKPKRAQVPVASATRKTIIIRRNGVIIKAPAVMSPEERASVIALAHDLSVA